MENYTTKEGKTIALVSYFTIVGLIISLILNRDKKNYFASFHIRQSIGLHVLYFANKWIIFEYFNSNIGWGLRILILILFVIGAISALQEEEKLVPVVGEKFQEWFKNI
ncbi:hypothetical protein FDT66_13245 [Polaribacter aestuariivivens]|uniref:DUF4870 domain-containing protein n=1 Tax=Polaribacter aestuariivivens TaxID=2304626 RepID=A0A5S3N331_9FLAO|nr:hypothetical protein [Polaribacter aestuariivivens]TMM28864.1 hypothetical protein FDT66_13245 [Polaribacter aestuariivivens]